MFRKILSLVLCLCLASVFGAASAESAWQPEYKEATLKLVLNVPAEVDLENNPLVQKVYERTGIKMEIEAPPQNSYWDRTRVIVASGEYPDIMLQGTDVDMEKWAEEGILAELDDKIQNYPNLMKNISAQQWSDARAQSTGKIVAVPRPNAYDYWGYVINQEWLDKLGLKAPTTIDEFVAVCRAFTFNDPDGNGKDDTTGCTFYNGGDMKLISLTTDFISTAYRISQHVGMPDRDNVFRVSGHNAEIQDYLTLMRSMYEEGILDREFLTHTTQQQMEEKFAQGRVGIIGYSGKSYLSGLCDKYNIPAEKVSFHAPLVKTEGDSPIYMMPPSNWCAYHIFASGDVDTSLRLLDYLNSEEGVELFQLGIQGVNYNSYDVENRTIDRTPEQLEGLKKITDGWFYFANAYLQRPLIERDGATEAEQTKWAKETSEANAVTDKYYVPFVKVLYTMQSDLPDETATLAMLVSRYVSGEIEWDELNDFLVNKYDPKIASYEEAYNKFMADNPVEIKR